MNDKIILHIDMNSYFASVEQQANPFLRGKPVGVCAYLSPGGCIIASSVEAKAKGIKTGMKAREALAIDPGVILIENEPAKYRSTTEKIFNILGEYTDTLEPYSIDEAFLDLTGWARDFFQATLIGALIQWRIKEEVGEWLNSSVGISWTKFLAKLSSDIAPKKGILAIEDEGKLIETLKGRPLQDAWGINRRLEARLRAIGIRDLLDLKNIDPLIVKRSLGQGGYYLWANVNGREISRVSQGTAAPKSIGHSYCLPRKTMDKKYLSGVLYKLSEKTGRRLRAQGFEAQQMNFGLAYTREGGVFKSFKTSEKMFTTEDVYGQAGKILSALDLVMPVRLLAVSVSRLSPLSGQLSFFDSQPRRKDLSLALDKLNDKYGEYTVINGAMFGTDDMARDRIGFRKIT